MEHESGVQWFLFRINGRYTLESFETLNGHLSEIKQRYFVNWHTTKQWYWKATRRKMNIPPIAWSDSHDVIETANV